MTISYLSSHEISLFPAYKKSTNRISGNLQSRIVSVAHTSPQRNTYILIEESQSTYSIKVALRAVVWQEQKLNKSRFSIQNLEKWKVRCMGKIGPVDYNTTLYDTIEYRVYTLRTIYHISIRFIWRCLFFPYKGPNVLYHIAIMLQ